MSKPIDYTPLLKNVSKWPREVMWMRLWSCIAMLRYNGYLTREEGKRLEREVHRDKRRADKQAAKSKSPAPTKKPEGKSK